MTGSKLTCRVVVSHVPVLFQCDRSTDGDTSGFWLDVFNIQGVTYLIS